MSLPGNAGSAASACPHHGRWENLKDEDDDSTTMSSSQRFVLAEQPFGQLPPSAGGSRSVSSITMRRKKRHNLKKLDLRSLNELDETVLSVGKLYSSSRRPGEEDESYSIATGDGQSIYTHPSLIDNMQIMNRSKSIGASTVGGSHSVQSNQSISRSSISRSSKKSKKKRRKKRGSSLERDISKAIIAAEAKNEKEGKLSQLLEKHNRRVQEQDAKSDATSTEFILHDLDQVSAIIDIEVATHASGDESHAGAASVDTHARRQRYACTPLLPPIASESYASQEDEDEEEEVAREYGFVKEPAPSDESGTASAFAKLNDLDFLTPTNSYVTKDESTTSSFYARSLWQATDDLDAAAAHTNKTKYHQWRKSGARSVGSYHERSWATTASMDGTAEHQQEHPSLSKETGFLDSDEWTSFGESPFLPPFGSVGGAGGGGGGVDNVSIESPSSIADFDKELSEPTHIRPSWKKSEKGWKTKTHGRVLV